MPDRMYPDYASGSEVIVLLQTGKWANILDAVTSWQYLNGIVFNPTFRDEVIEAIIPTFQNDQTDKGGLIIAVYPLLKLGIRNETARLFVPVLQKLAGDEITDENAIFHYTKQFLIDRHDMPVGT